MRVPESFRGKRFVLTKDHVKLLRQMIVGWSETEFGAPEVDPKRPYGNSDVVRDVLTILDWNVPRCPNCGAILDDGKVETQARELHFETATALQVVLSSGSFRPGVYRRDDEYQRDWQFVGEEPEDGDV